MYRCVRVLLDAGDDPHMNMTVDLILDTHGVPRRGVPFCGWWGLVKSTEVTPMIILPDGRVDFGSDENTNQTDRFGTINLHDRRIEPSAMITFSDSWGFETLYRVGRITDLLE